MDLANLNTTMSSREIAELTGKQHKNVLTDCEVLNRNYKEMRLAEISADLYKDSYGRKQRQFLLSKIQTMDLLTGYSIPLRIKVNRRWEELEQERANPLISNTTLLALTTQLKKDRDELSKDLAKLEARADKLEAIEEFILKSVGQSSLTANQPQQVNEPWQSIFIDDYGKPTFDFIEKHFNEWVERKEISVKEFNDTYKFRQLPLRIFLQAIFQYSARNKVHFTRHKVIKRESESLRVRLFIKH